MVLDKDIDILKNIINKMKKNRFIIQYKDLYINDEDIQTIENVLKELENYKSQKIYHCQQYEIVHLTKELKTKDKVIDAMAETMALDIMYADEDKDVQTMKEKIKEKYRKKVEKDVKD